MNIHFPYAHKHVSKRKGMNIIQNLLTESLKRFQIYKRIWLETPGNTFLVIRNFFFINEIFFFFLPIEI